MAQHTLELSQEDTDQFAALNKRMVTFKVAIKLSRKRGNGKKKVRKQTANNDVILV